MVPQALLLTGTRGVGLKTTALSIARQSTILAFVEPSLLTKTSTIPVIGIDAIRNLYTNTRSKSSTPNIVIIDDADVMTREAQNSFLKLLEEPNSSTRFILTSHRPELLLPTVRSRLQTLHLPNISTQASKDLIESLGSVEAPKLRQVLFIAEGLPAEITRLLSDEKYFTATVSTMGFAKKLIESTAYERIQHVFGTKTDKVEVMQVIRRCVELLSRSPSEQSLLMIERLLKAEEAITQNGNPRLHLVNAVI
jgi:DNA polymerase III subunit delta'